jgi:ketosteroid isomerase-like protein
MKVETVKTRTATLRRMADAWNARDVDGILDAFDPDPEVIFPPDVPEPGPFHGRDQLRRWVEGFFASWEEHRVEIELVEPAGEDLFAVTEHHAKGRDTGIELHQKDGHLFSFARDRISGWRNFHDVRDSDEARREAGLG